MSQLIPALDDCLARSDWLNDGERRVLAALAELDDGWTIYVQPRLGLDMPDFVALSDRYGVCAIEVKDWSRKRYENRNGQVFHRSGATEWARVEQHPRLQAYRYLTTIFEHSFAFPDDGRLIPPSVRGLVILLNHSTKDAHDVLAVKSGDPARRVSVVGEEALGNPEATLVGNAPARPRPESMAKLRRHLDSATFLASLAEPQQLSPGAANIARNPNNATMRRVRGSAGCGKSYGLAARAAALAAQGTSVLVVSYNLTLSHYLRSLVTMHCASYGADPTRVRCTHFHGLCRRVVDDAFAAGIEVPAIEHGPMPDRVIEQARQASALGVRHGWGAILVDEGQDFRLDWWNLLREQIAPGGEMLLVSDPTQNIYGQTPWTEEDHMTGAGFSGPWTDLGDSYRLPSDMVGVIRGFGTTYVGGDVVGPTVPKREAALPGIDVATERRWQNVASPSNLPLKLAEFVASLTRTDGLDPSEIVVLCGSHRVGERVVRQLDRMGIDIHHIFASDPDERRRRKTRFWPDAAGVKGCTIHSFKGWESRAVVLGIDDGDDAARLAYVAMTRLQADRGGRGSYIAVVNANRNLMDFRDSFKWGVKLPPPNPRGQVA